jgi:hypothetical protein
MDSKWGLTAHRVTLMICTTCRFVMTFSKGRTIWDFDWAFHGLWFVLS